MCCVVEVDEHRYELKRRQVKERDIKSRGEIKEQRVIKISVGRVGSEIGSEGDEGGREKVGEEINFVVSVGEGWLRVLLVCCGVIGNTCAARKYLGNILGIQNALARSRLVRWWSDLKFTLLCSHTRYAIEQND